MIWQAYPSSTDPVILVSAKKKRVRIDNFFIVNPEASSYSASIFLDPDGLGAGNINSILNSYSVSAHGVYNPITSPIYLDPGANIQVVSSTGSKLAFTATGEEFNA